VPHDVAAVDAREITTGASYPHIVSHTVHGLGVARQRGVVTNRCWTRAPGFVGERYRSWSKSGSG
jgi:hypothetical protein